MDVKIMTVSSAKCRNPQQRRPKIRLSGDWLNTIGFEYDRLVTVNHENGNLIFKAHGAGLDGYLTLVKGALKNQSGLLQVRYAKANKKDVPSFEVKGKWLHDLGFTIGNVIAVQFRHGVITINLLEVEKLFVSDKGLL